MVHPPPAGGDNGPDIIGTQEGLYSQINGIAADLPEYDWLGQGRAGGTVDEFCAILYRRDRFEVIDGGHFWLSDTPDTVGSMTWGNSWLPFPANEPLLILGDFNCVAEDSVPFETLLDYTGLVDTWTTADTRPPAKPDITYHAYRGLINSGERIDWIWARCPQWVDTAAIITAGPVTIFPSPPKSFGSRGTLGDPDEADSEPGG